LEYKSLKQSAKTENRPLSYTSIVQEYVDSKYTNKLGAIFIVVENMIVQIQRPLSNPKISQALENIKFEVIYVSE